MNRSPISSSSLPSITGSKKALPRLRTWNFPYLETQAIQVKFLSDSGDFLEYGQQHMIEVSPSDQSSFRKEARCVSGSKQCRAEDKVYKECVGGEWEREELWSIR